jgi:hypothetical protein
MNTHKTNMTALVLALAAFGCDEDYGQDGDFVVDDAVAWRQTADNGMRINGMRINGMRINGMRINGDILQGDAGGDKVEIVSVDLPGSDEPAGTWIADGNLYVKTTGGAVLTGPALSNTIITLNVTEGGVTRQREVWIGQVQPSASQPAIWQYSANLWGEDIGWGPACTDGNGYPTQSFLLNDVWDPKSGKKLSPRPSGALTVACRGAALAKCVEFGYAPWKVKDGVSMADFHQACTRMVRADYCGDGQPHTVNGTKIHVLDPIGVQKVDPTVSYVVEAEWGPDGAVCLNPGNTRLANQTIGCQIPTCGASFASGGLIQSGKLVAP